MTDDELLAIVRRAAHTFCQRKRRSSAHTRLYPGECYGVAWIAGHEALDDEINLERYGETHIYKHCIWALLRWYHYERPRGGAQVVRAEKRDEKHLHLDESYDVPYEVDLLQRIDDADACDYLAGTLNDHQREIAALLGHGLSAPEIAQRMSKGAAWMRHERRRVLTRMRVRFQGSQLRCECYPEIDLTELLERTDDRYFVLERQVRQQARGRSRKTRHLSQRTTTNGADRGKMRSRRIAGGKRGAGTAEKAKMIDKFYDAHCQGKD